MADAKPNDEKEEEEAPAAAHTTKGVRFNNPQREDEREQYELNLFYNNLLMC